jgi:two-component system, response regulator YesN
VETLRGAIITSRREEIKQFFQDLMYALTESETITPDYSRGVFIELLSEIHSVIKIYDLDEKEFIGTYADFFKKLFRQRSMIRTIDWLEEVALAVADRLLTGRGGARSLGERVEEYVCANYAKALSLKTISFTFGVSAAYLGHIFKEQTGQSFSEYLNRYRLERAHYLLTHSGVSAKEAARAVGYSDPNYFYRVFKKYLGIFPSELPQWDQKKAPPPAPDRDQS